MYYWGEIKMLDEMPGKFWRGKKAFLWKPKTINSKTKWLQKAKWKEETKSIIKHTNKDNGNTFYVVEWEIKEWV